MAGSIGAFIYHEASDNTLVKLYNGVIDIGERWQMTLQSLETASAHNHGKYTFRVMHTNLYLGINAND